MMPIDRVVTCRFVGTGKRDKDGGPTIGARPVATQPRNAGWRRCIIDAPVVGAVGGESRTAPYSQARLRTRSPHALSGHRCIIRQPGVVSRFEPMQIIRAAAGNARRHLLPTGSRSDPQLPIICGGDDEDHRLGGARDPRAPPFFFFSRAPRPLAVAARAGQNTIAPSRAAARRRTARWPRSG